MPEATGIRARQRERTRRTLLREGRRLFAEHGYAEVGLNGVVTAAKVTKGALYHHFDGKPDLFRAVLEEVQAEVADEVAGAADAVSAPWERLTAGCRAFLVAATAPDVRRIMLVDGPAVLGWSTWREMDEANSVRHLTEALTDLVAAGVLPPRPVEPVAHLLSGAMNEAALWLAGRTGPDDLDEVWAVLSRMLESLRTDRDRNDDR
ncbi:TetR/AcrR family transcriptional regulator [Nocardiopsis lambiniae]|uniref:TetR/AcrR family transcriptional regulator n=1 Tax=Nocardiopsis lambiniae TaxID=3075539 RepID=A0ABU2MAP7_9ACTN|nr:TetR/AcrR family transcriptional regulator [Nocardiopsis sp. DSM 44743]MDT0329653.1 TetR/AcrR family transcriptional regulator [Nocardiopsis sp. DSM 44743]